MSASFQHSTQLPLESKATRHETSSPCAEARAIAARHLAQVDDRLADLSQIRAVLRRLIQSYAEDGQPDCAILDALTADRSEPDGA